MEFTLLGAVLLAVGAVYATLYWEAKRGNAADCARNLWDTALAGVIAGMVVGRLAAMVADGVNPLTNPQDIIIVRAGVATGPAALAALATVGWLGRRELWTVLDGLAPATLAGLAGWHAGCLVRGSCLGTASDLPWAFATAGSSVTRHPVELYAAALYLIAAIVLAWWKKSGRPAGAVPSGLALAAAGGVRWLTEAMRPSLGGGPVAWYAAALLAGVGLVAWRLRGGRLPAGDTGER